MRVPTETVLWGRGKIANRKQGPRGLLDSTPLGSQTPCPIAVAPKVAKEPNPVIHV